MLPAPDKRQAWAQGARTSWGRGGCTQSRRVGARPGALFTAPRALSTVLADRSKRQNPPGSPLAQPPAPQHRVLPIWFRDKLSCGMALAGCPQMLEFLPSLMAITKGLATWLVPFCVAAYVVTYFVMAVFFMSFWTQQHGPRMSPFCRKTRTREKL